MIAAAHGADAPRTPLLVNADAGEMECDQDDIESDDESREDEEDWHAKKQKSVAGGAPGRTSDHGIGYRTRKSITNYERLPISNWGSLDV